MKQHRHKWQVKCEDGEVIAVCTAQTEQTEDCKAQLTRAEIEHLLNLLERIAD